MRRLSIYLAMIEGEAAQDKFERLYHAYRDLMFYRAKQLLPEKMLAEDADVYKRQSQSRIATISAKVAGFAVKVATALTWLL